LPKSVPYRRQIAVCEQSDRKKNQYKSGRVNYYRIELTAGVVKRPIKAAYLDGQKPALSMNMKKHRFDIYL